MNIRQRSSISPSQISRDILYTDWHQHVFLLFSFMQYHHLKFTWYRSMRTTKICLRKFAAKSGD
ncbi:Uncharacterized protein BM_BM1185 [Brugia malayi]|uniref:Bm1185, isoform a n=2 Tax=Brugia TaxID=6278 RepID=A0A1I9GEX9_BRUMA|nr:Uncharacterized protein BM_BM1185 [Brugia malayi]CDP92346.1 Bm1185, isoform a [Brugia malayi]VDO21109.1 unnamed protein product [Brugia timori]VIO94374.1 Uncharacterized protein BM_BM1185 [Brugia malayi]